MTSWPHARQRVYESASPLDREEVALTAAIGRVLADDLFALTDLPATHTSAMDGWAVAGEGPWQIVGEIRAGHSTTTTLHPGQAIAIATGASVPEGTTSIIKSEDGITSKSQLEAPTTFDEHIRPKGEEANEGDLLITKGTTLTPLHIGLAAATGHDKFAVTRKPRVRIAIFGDELLHSGRPTSGQIRDSLGPQLPAWLTSWGCEVLDVQFLPDTLQAHIDALNASDADIVITTGGTANGPVDFIHDAVNKLNGEWIVDSVDCRPGHPMLAAKFSTHHLVGLPGNPQAAIAALHTLAAPLIRRLLGLELPQLPTIEFKGTAKRRDRETRLIPCTLNDNIATPVDHIGSGMLRGLTHADGFAVISANDSVRWLALQAL